MSAPTLDRAKKALRYYAMVAFNWLQGCRFFWKDGSLEMTEKCCPYPIRFDWSVKACVKAGDCGCVKGSRPTIERRKNETES